MFSIAAVFFYFLLFTNYTLRLYHWIAPPLRGFFYEKFWIRFNLIRRPDKNHDL